MGTIETKNNFVLAGDRAVVSAGQLVSRTPARTHSPSSQEGWYGFIFLLLISFFLDSCFQPIVIHTTNYYSTKPVT